MKRLIAKLFGPLLLILGGVFLLTTCRVLFAGQIRSFGYISFIFSAGSAYLFFWGGLRAVRLGFGPDEIVPPRMTVWKLTVGFWLISAELKNTFDPSPNLLKANNASEAFGMTIAKIAIYAFAIWLLFSGVKAKYRRSQLPSQLGPL